MGKKLISIGCCCYNEEGNVEKAYEAMLWLIEQCPDYNFEMIFSDNCSRDRTKEILRNIAKHDRRVKVIFNQTNFGANRSSRNLLKSLHGDAYIGLACDLQEPVEVLPEFIKIWEEGYDAVWGQKTRSEENPIKYFCRNVYYSIIDFFSDYKQIRQTNCFGITSMHLINAYLYTALQDPDVSLRHWVAEYGYKIKLLPYTQRQRMWGKSSYNLAGSFDFAITSLCNTSTKPLRIMMLTGLFTGIMCIIVAVAYLIYKLIYWHSFDVGVAPLVIGLFFVMSIQLFSIGILGEYVRVLLKKVTNKVLVVEEERINFNNIENDEV